MEQQQDIYSSSLEKDIYHKLYKSLQMKCIQMDMGLS